MPSALSLADAKTHLNISATTYDTELQAVIDSAEATLAQRVGPLQATATTRRLSGGVKVLSLPVTPAIGLTSVTPYQGSALTLSDLYLDTATGLVTQNDGTGFPATYYDVVYSAGRTTVPNDLLFAVKELVRHMWESQRGPKVRAAGEMAPGAAHLLPYRVAELIAPHVRVLVS